MTELRPSSRVLLGGAALLLGLAVAGCGVDPVSPGFEDPNCEEEPLAQGCPPPEDPGANLLVPDAVGRLPDAGTGG